MAEDYENWYVQQFRNSLNETLNETDGISDADIESLLEGREIPAAMRAYYRVAGNHWMNTSYNRLRTLDDFEAVDGYTIFMDENQVVVQWAIRDSEMTKDDPLVYLGQLVDDGHQWYAEDLTFSRFIIDTWKETLTGEP
jgi:hypothetical protein